ncbi:TVP38/TMEM64 family protein [sulfur-oxidizing endosymbiont of Gigantopelta aegis]|uniref:TVP38/TMEM64 family protein n=1 Tax=sulfur-oxidizing endosymbiont of Gigantopelta aegis TaxID=2794934 RepID=UPI0018DD3F60|nr:TVP38/TMEM64 family protein [sulfur-oxidizing endosymbiont of Gigantopelta aegis]
MSCVHKNYKPGRILVFIMIIALLAGIYWLLNATGFVALLLDTEQFKQYIQSTGYWGVLIIIALMAFAILFKLLPSAAVALASGAAYGHTWGTIYIILGAWLGAIIAFSITRLLGNDALCRLSGRRIKLEQEQSQSWLMWGLLVSRFIPIIPYDIVSYAMGLTPLKLWRFSIATLIGVIPTSFFLAHVGGELAKIDFDAMFSGMMLAGLVVLLPVSIAMFVFYRYGQFKTLFSIKKCESNRSN